MALTKAHFEFVRGILAAMKSEELLQLAKESSDLIAHPARLKKEVRYLREKFSGWNIPLGDDDMVTLTRWMSVYIPQEISSRSEKGEG